MSTEHQRYSLDNQIAAIAEYAELRGLAVVQTYADAGKSGLSLKGRDGLKALLADVVRAQRAYAAILVLDVSRWADFRIRTNHPARQGQRRCELPKRQTLSLTIYLTAIA